MQHPSLRQRIESIWRAEGSSAPAAGAVLRAALRGASVLYGAGAAARGMAFDCGVRRARRVDCPVISVGNLTVGGTGKTPLVIEIARALSRGGRRVAVVSRGYGRVARRPVVVVSDGSGAIVAPRDEAGDEPMLIARRAPDAAVVVGADRCAAARVAREHCGAQVIVLDDGFQHRALGRDCDIVAWDATRRPETMALLPRGPLRESLAALRRAHAVVFTRCREGRMPEDTAERFRAVAPGLEFFAAQWQAQELDPLDGGPARPAADLEGRAVAAWCGVGDPESFWRLIEGCGARVVERCAFPDHHRPSPAELDALEDLARRAGAKWAVMTEKDRENLPEEWRPGLPTFVVRARMQLGGDSDRFGAFLERFAPSRRGGGAGARA